MLPLLTAILIASILGSTHCAGMCGAFVAFAVGAGGGEDGPAPVSRLGLGVAYNAGRLVTYMTLGAVAGGVGAALDLGASMVGIQRAAACVAGASMAGFGLVAVLRHAGARVPRLPAPRALVRFVSAAHGRAMGLSPFARAAGVGLLTTLLPCGWLYAFVVSSAGTANPVLGAAAMSVFWLGTLPMMAAVGLGVHAVAGPFRRHMPLATSLLLVAVGLATVLGRMTLPPVRASASPPASSMREAVEAVDRAGDACPLCTPRSE
ncbi:MAG: sulfite exporter TauE/SafE family protein [Phycisphaerae bacterium]|nr:sulfite exporter TauE/SafE family protein [Phycisphaerae bacterium]